MTLTPLKAGLEALTKANKTFVTLFQHGTLEIELYRPVKVDLQTPHDRDEVYVVASGSGVFACGEERCAFGPSDVLFVPARAVHRFEDFSDDFQTWVIFYGPVGGERA